MSNRFHDILIAIRDFLFGTFNKEFLIFLFFLVLSSVYWLMSVLNETMEREIVIPVQLTNVPRNVIVIGDSTLSVRAVVRDKGYAIATYLYGDRITPVKLMFSLYAHNQDRLTVTSAELSKMVRDQLYGSSKLVAVKPDHLEIPYNFGLRKRVPVKMLGNVNTTGNYYLTRVEFLPESVYVYSSARILDSIAIAYTERLDIEDVTDTITRTVALKNIKGAKFVPSHVKMTLFTDIITEAMSMVPITSVNVPAGSILRTFPTQVQVRYVVPASEYKHIDEDDFEVVADYATTDEGTSDKCQIKLVKSPRAVRSPMLSVSEVDYLIEQ